MPQHEQEREQQLQELAHQQRCAPGCLSEREALQLASLHSVSRALLLLSAQLSQSGTGSVR